MKERSCDPADTVSGSGRRRTAAVGHVREVRGRAGNQRRVMIFVSERLGARRGERHGLPPARATVSAIGEEAVSLERQIGAKGGRITPEKVEQFAEAMRAKLRDASDPQVRRRYVRAFVGEVVMSRELIAIRGPNRALELAAAGEISASYWNVALPIVYHASLCNVLR